MKKYLTLILMTLTCMNIIASEISWFSQNDARWKSNRLGGSSSIGRSGCVVSCLSMLLNAEASNSYVTPDKLNDWLRKNGGYSGNNMRWQIPGQMDGSGLGLELVAQSTKRNDWSFLSTELEKGNKVIVKVSGRRSHWVLVVKQEGPVNQASSYFVNDPGMDKYEPRTLAFWGGFRSARSYSGNWLDEQAFELNSEIYVVPVNNDESFLYGLYELPVPANVFVTLENKLNVEIQGFFILGMFNSEGDFLYPVDYEHASVAANSNVDLLYEMPDFEVLNRDQNTLKIVYSKYFSQMPSMYDTLKLIPQGVVNLTQGEE